MHMNELDTVAVGKPLPFSVYNGDRKLLLAKGEVVETERMLDLLLRSGRSIDGEPLSRKLASMNGEAVGDDVFSGYINDFNVASGQARVGARLSREESSENYPCWVLGADDQHGLIVTAPSKADRSLLPIAEGQTWVFRLLYLTAACKFTSVIRKVQFDPSPLLHIAPPRQVEMRMIRGSPRVLSCVRAAIEVDKEEPALLTDVGVGGACVAVERARVSLQPGQRLSLSFRISVLDTDYDFRVPATVVSIRSEFDKRYPALQFAGVKIEALSEIERLVLHGYVFERTATDFNALWKALLGNRV